MANIRLIVFWFYVQDLAAEIVLLAKISGMGIRRVAHICLFPQIDS